MTQHASSSPPPPPGSEPSHAERVRTLLSMERLGTLATQSVHHAGYPFASVMPYALDATASPLFLISSMAIHTQNVVADARAITIPTQLLISGADWVMHHPPQHEFFVNLGTPIKERHHRVANVPMAKVRPLMTMSMIEKLAMPSSATG